MNLEKQWLFLRTAHSLVTLMHAEMANRAWKLARYFAQDNGAEPLFLETGLGEDMVEALGTQEVVHAFGIEETTPVLVDWGKLFWLSPEGLKRFMGMLQSNSGTGNLYTPTERQAIARVVLLKRLNLEKRERPFECMKWRNSILIAALAGDSPFKVVIANMTLHRLKGRVSPREFLKKSATYMASGGVIVCTVPGHFWQPSGTPSQKSGEFLDSPYFIRFQLNLQKALEPYVKEVQAAPPSSMVIRQRELEGVPGYRLLGVNSCQHAPVVPYETVCRGLGMMAAMESLKQERQEAEISGDLLAEIATQVSQAATQTSAEADGLQVGAASTAYYAILQKQ